MLNRLMDKLRFNSKLVVHWVWVVWISHTGLLTDEKGVHRNTYRVEVIVQAKCQGARLIESYTILMLTLDFKHQPFNQCSQVSFCRPYEAHCCLKVLNLSVMNEELVQGCTHCLANCEGSGDRDTTNGHRVMGRGWQCLDTD